MNAAKTDRQDAIQQAICTGISVNRGLNAA